METAQGAPTQNGLDAASSSTAAKTVPELENYSLPTARLRMRLSEKDKGRVPLVLCACGSFSPITYRLLSLPAKNLET
jgi:hypothetical protein